MKFSTSKYLLLILILSSCSINKRVNDLSGIDNGIILKHTAENVTIDSINRNSIIQNYKVSESEDLRTGRVLYSNYLFEEKGKKTYKNAFSESNNPRIKHFSKRSIRKKIKSKIKNAKRDNKTNGGGGGYVFAIIIIAALFIWLLTWLGVPLGQILLYLLLGLLLGAAFAILLLAIVD